MINIAWIGAQVTIVMGAGVLLYRLASRRGPAVRSFVAASTLGLVPVSTLLAFLPCPGWWDWPALTLPVGQRLSIPASGAASASTTRPGSPGVETLGHDGGPGWSLDYLRALGAWLDRAESRGPARGWRPSSLLGSCVAAGASLAIVRLVLGLWAVSRCRVRSRPIEDPRLAALVAELRAAMGCRRPVELGETSELTGAATVGWRHPLVLLPLDWTTWSESELRAVLAHEIAHVCGGDYLAGVVGRLGVALHVYHPLAHWLAGRLRLEQELAADALGVRFGGGRAAYLRVLSQMALRQEERPFGPARMFLAGKGTLIRRIEMLRDDRPSADDGVRRSGRVLLAAPLMLVALAASGLRVPERQARAEEPASEIREKNSEAFDLSYIPRDVQGIAAMRPAAAFRHPGMKPQAEKVKTLLNGVFPGSTLRVEEIELVALGVYADTIKTAKPNQPSHRLMMNGLMARSVRPFDWKGEVERLFKVLGQGKLVEAKHGDSVYYKATGFPERSPIGAVYFPDDRTIVAYPEHILLPMIDGKGHGGPEFARNEDWKQVEGGLFAVMLDNRKGIFNPTPLEEMNPEEKAMAAILEKTDRLTFGVRDAENLAIRVIARSQAHRAGAAIARAGESLRELLQKDIENPRDPECKCGKDHARVIRITDEVVEKIRIKSGDGPVEFGSETQVGLPELMAAITAGEFH